MSRPARLVLFCLAGALATGGIATLAVFSGVGPAEATPSASVLIAGAVYAGLSLISLFVRFTRWQFALRRLEARIPTVESLATFGASFAFLPIPLLLGQLAARRQLLPEALRPPLASVVMAFVWARLLDVWALCVLCTLALSGWAGAAVTAAALAPLVPRIRAAGFRAVLGSIAGAWQLLSSSPLCFEEAKIARLLSIRTLAAGATGALVAWSLVGATLAGLAAAAGIDASPLALAGVAAAGVLFGGLSLLPMGVVVAGLVMLELLDGLGAPPGLALEVVFVHRLITTWLSVALGVVTLIVSRRLLQRAPDPGHFDTIDHSYDSWLPPHYRDHVVGKKVAHMRRMLGGREGPLLGLDLGCGRGWYLDGVRASGGDVEDSPSTRVVGMDLSRRQLVAASGYVGGTTPLCRASMLALPFRPRSYDFAYAINVVHHLGSPSEQRRAFEEVARVLRTDGLFFLHEMNVRNPIFRGYLSYVFPVIKGIDEGVEYFLDPRQLPLPDSLELVSVEYFTFVPDLCPESLLPAMQAIEARLERSPIAPLAAHFVAVLRRRGDS